MAYIAPVGSNYCSFKCFDLLESDILNLASNDFKLCFLGNFNARTRNEYDFTAVDANIKQSLDIGNADIRLDYCSIDQLGLSTEIYKSDLSLHATIRAL